MQREFVACSGVRCSESSFLAEQRQRGFELDRSGMIAGLALAMDFRASLDYRRYGKLM